MGKALRYYRNHWSRRSDLNRGPADYESAALPLSYAGLFRDFMKDGFIFTTFWVGRQSSER